MNAKMIPNEDGTGLKLPSAEELKDYEGPFIDISYDFAPTPAKEI